MKWSWRIARVAGIGIYIHATFFLLLAWIAFAEYRHAGTIGAVVEALAFILALFGTVVLHELGHALTARRYGIATRDITLLPIGGVARLERLPDKPIEELWVALMGPAVNVVIAAVLFVYLYFTGGLAELRDLSVTSGSFLTRLMLVNISLVLFNLLPAFPMDGGRVLRALLAMRMDYVRATQVAASIGQGMAFLFGLFGLFNNPFLLFIAFFVWIGASQEANMVQIRNSISGIPVTNAMQTRFDTLSPSDRLDRVVNLILAGSQQDFPAVENGQFVGLLTRDDFIRALSEHGQNTPVAEVLRRNVPSVDSHDMVETALMRLQETGAKTLPVMHAGRFVGLVTSENITEFLMIRSALKAASATPNPIM